ncbi:MAG: hypothetical protein JW715_15655 [Sedimentisphaerales bacterium]|nr:hypothetical protein [Sedimentisphaerales bacterium]
MEINQISASSVAANFKTWYSRFLDTCYHFTGEDYKVQGSQKESSIEESSEDTAIIREIENSVFKSVGAECMEFCDSKDLTNILADCLKRAKILFSNILKLSAELDYFREDECENTEHVVIRVEVKTSQQTMLEEYDEMVSWMAKNIAPSQGEYFTVNIKRV